MRVKNQIVVAALLAMGFTILALQQNVAAQSQAPARPSVVPAARGIVDVDGGLVQIAAQRDGVIREVLVDEGATVRRDQPLAIVDDRAAVIQLGIVDAQLGERRAAAEAQMVKVTTALRERDRLVPLARSRAIAQKSLDDAGSELKLAEAELNSRRAEIATAEAQLRSAAYEKEVRTVRAPSDGMIIRRLVRPGDGLSTQNVTSLFWFAPSIERIVRAEIEEQFAQLVRKGQQVEILLETDDKAVAARGHVSRVGRAFGPRRATTYEPRDRADVRVLEAIITVDGEALAVPLGQRVIVRFLDGGQK